MRYNPVTLSLIVFGFLSVFSVYQSTQLQFSFSFEQFFPKGDDDLDFFKEFIEEFEADDNFLLVAVREPDGIFQQAFLESFHDFTLQSAKLPYILESQSVTKFSYPLKTPFGLTTIPAIHLDDPTRYQKDKERLLQDERFVDNFISRDAEIATVFLKTEEGLSFGAADTLLKALDQLIINYEFAEHHYLGRAYFQRDLVELQKREVILSAVVSFILVTLIMYLIFRRPWGILVALVSIALGLLFFLGYMGLFGRELNAMSALYPIIMIMVGTSDVIHIMTKYIDELRKGKERNEAAIITIKEIGLATLLTSVTTAIGFASLLSSRIVPIQELGVNAAVGVMIAYVTVIGFTAIILTRFGAEQLMQPHSGYSFWERIMKATNLFTKRNPVRIAIGSTFVLGLCALGISMITTNFDISGNLPRGAKITEDFRFFEKNLTGFRPLEFAVFPQDSLKVYDYKVIKEIDKVEQKLAETEGIRAISSVTTIFKSINQMFNANRVEAYQIPEPEARFNRYLSFAEKIPSNQANILVNKDQTKARISSRIFDIGADSVKMVVDELQAWTTENVDTNVIKIRQTGTALIIDKNAEYIRRDLLLGLGLAILIVSTLMAMLFKDWKMLIISLIPNVFPLLMAGALLGFLGIELEAGISIVFAAIFGIAVDDTIHFLSKYKLARDKGYSIEKSIDITFLETGKAIVLTTIILFFGFLIMLFSKNPASFTVGMLISVTLFGALISDSLIIPVLIRWWLKPKEEQEQEPNTARQLKLDASS